MTAPPQVDTGIGYVIELPEPDDFEFWRDRARALVQCGVPPDRISWVAPGGSRDLFTHGERYAPVPPAGAPMVRASKQFVQIAKGAICHADPDRFALLYRLLWRLQRNRYVLEDRADPDVRRLDELTRQVRRDIHKMRAFVRFRLVENGEEVEDGHGVGSEAEDGAAPYPHAAAQSRAEQAEGPAAPTAPHPQRAGAPIDEPVKLPTDHYVAWFEPEHHILRANAGFFVRRFANMRWSILTPMGSLHWDGEALSEGPPATRSDAPAGDPVEALWREYYASIFNPARLKIGAMLREMPRKYWKNMPEAALIPELVAGAQARESAMVDAGTFSSDERPDTLDGIAKAIHQCRRCPIGELENQAVMGEGLRQSTLMVVGEQPGDQEDLAGKPFVGPAGQVLDRFLVQAGIDREQTYVTNAVKHFKFVHRGKRRLHQSPSAKEIDICRWWLEGERELVRPKVVLALGASAARSLLGKTVSISRARGQPHPLEDGSELWVTAHPSYLLRLDGPARDEQERLFAADLAAVAERLADLVD